MRIYQTKVIICSIVVLIVLSGCFCVESEPEEFTMPEENLQLWLRADAGVVTEDNLVVSWEDQSGNDNHAVAEGGSAPLLVNDVLNGSPVLRFDGANTYLRVAHQEQFNTTDGLSVLVVYDHQSGFRLIQKKDGASGSQEDAWFVMPLGGLSIAGIQEGGVLFERGDIYHLQSSVYDANAGQIEIYANGMVMSVLTGVVPQVPNTDDVYIGKRNRPSSTEGHLLGNIAEIIIYNRALPVAERQMIERYLQGKYGF